MRDLGYAEGRGFTLVERFAEGRNDRLPSLAAELVKLRVDLILASTTNAVKAAQAVTSTIPIVFESVADPIAAGVAASVSRPGGNITGLSNFSIDLSPKRFQLLTQLLPGLRESRGPPQPLQSVLRGAEAGDRGRPPASWGCASTSCDARHAEEVDAAFRTMAARRARRALRHRRRLPVRAAAAGSRRRWR